MRLWILLLFSLNLFAQADIDAFFDRFTKEWVRGDPQMASRTQMFTGDEQDRLDRELTPQTLAYTQQRVRLARKSLAELKRFDRSKFSESQKVSAAFLEWMLDSNVRGERFQNHAYVFNQQWGLLRFLPLFLTELPMRGGRDAQNYLARLGKVAARMDEAIADAGRREKAGIVPPKRLITVTLEQMQRFIAPEPAKNLFITTFAERLQNTPGLSAAAKTDLLKTAEATVGESIYPAYRRVIALLESQLPAASADDGFWRLPDGLAAYDERLRSYTTTSLSAEEIHQIGLKEIARIEKEVDRVLTALGETEGTREERLKRAESKRPGVLEAKPGAREAILGEYDQIIRDAERRAVDLFDLRPKAPVRVLPVPEYRAANDPASYTPPAPDGSRPGTFWVPLRGPTFAASRTLAYHEAVPGHHFQLALQQENADLPAFRRHPVFGFLSAFVEGWGLYAERLAWEEGWYKGDLHGELDYLVSSDLFRAKRLLVDTGLHAKRWSIDQGIAYGIRRNEVERYAANPGQACSYKIGELKIVELREKAKRELGGTFSLKEFHSTVLRHGALPMDVLAMVVDQYIRDRRNGQ